MKKDTMFIAQLAQLITEENALMTDDLPQKLEADSATVADMERFLQNKFDKDNIYGSAQIEGCSTHIIGVVFKLDGLVFIAADDLHEGDQIEEFFEAYQDNSTFQTMVDLHGPTITEFKKVFADYLLWLQKKHMPTNKVPLSLDGSFAGGITGQLKSVYAWKGHGIRVEYSIEDSSANW